MFIPGSLFATPLYKKTVLGTRPCRRCQDFNIRSRNMQLLDQRILIYIAMILSRLILFVKIIPVIIISNINKMCLEQINYSILRKSDPRVIDLK